MKDVKDLMIGFVENRMRGIDDCDGYEESFEDMNDEELLELRKEFEEMEKEFYLILKRVIVDIGIVDNLRSELRRE